MTRLYCLECNTILGESIGLGHGDSDHGLGLCQTCVQHGRGPAGGATPGTSWGGPREPAPPVRSSARTPA